ncbi:MAG: AMP-binding protein, partial [Usitatibacter sp.]
MGGMRAVAIETTDSIPDVFARRVAATPDAVAYRDYDAASSIWKDFTWRSAAEAVAVMRAGLAREELSPGDRVAIMSRNCREWILFDQAALASGLVVVPIYSDDRPDNIAYCLDNAGVKLILVEGGEQIRKLLPVLDRLQGLQRIICIKPTNEATEARVVSITQWLEGAGSAPARVKMDGNALATVVYTSGTTGKPKGVMLSHQNMLQDVRGGLGVYEVLESDVFLSFLPLSHMLERTVGGYLTMAAGSTVAFARSIALLGEDFKSVRPTIIVSVPRIFEKLHGQIQSTLNSASSMKRSMFERAHHVGWDMFEWKQGRGSWKPAFLLWPLLKALVADKLLERLGGRLRLCISGGAALNPQIARTFIGLGLPICQGYGLTEASPIVSVNHLDRNDPASIGMVLPGIEVSLGKNQVLLVRGPTVMQGYWKDEEATAKVISAEGWLDTGDQVMMKDGFLYITGRLKEIIVLGNGEKVPPVDMELAIQL